MENQLLKGAMSYGIFEILFCYLLLYVLKTQEKRDEKYQEIISENQTILEELIQKFNIIEDVKEDVKEIKSCMLRTGRKDKLSIVGSKNYYDPAGHLFPFLHTYYEPSIVSF